jgi:Polyketide cyclase / dehydrase and lipid transport
MSTHSRSVTGVAGGLVEVDAIGYAVIAAEQDGSTFAMARFSFVDHWEFSAPIDVVWNEIADAAKWPSWWPSMARVEELEPGDEQGLGAVRRYTVKGALPYRVSFDMRTTVIDVHRRIEGEALGDVAGRGRWTFSADGTTTTRVSYEWTVDVQKAWMVLFAPIMRPLFGWNHHHVMRRGLQGLTSRLATRS